MQPDSLVELSHRALMLVLWLSLPAVLTAAAVGLAVAVMQATTQVQDQSIGQALKLIAVFLVLAVTAKWAAVEIFHFADQLLGSFGLPAANKPL
jgi:type III secretion protein S